MNDQEVIALFKCLSDKSRLSILKSLLVEDMYVERLSERLQITPATVCFHLKKLEAAGAVSSHKDQYYTMYSINRDLFDKKIIAILSEKADDNDLQQERDEKYRQKVLEAFFKYGKLKSIPSQRKKARIVYEEIIKAFEENHDYTEREVNIIIADYHDDFCTIRRDMISEGLLECDNMIYRKVKK